MPAHDTRDHEFATKYGLPIKQVVAPSGKVEVDVQKEAYTGPGTLINSANPEKDLDFNGVKNKVRVPEAGQKWLARRGGRRV